MKKIVYIVLFVTIGLFAILGLFIYFYNGNETNRNSYDTIPISNEELQWGMSKNEVIEILGDPATIEENDAGVNLIYSKSITSELGTCTEMILSIGEQNDIPSGLGHLYLTIENTTLEEIIENLNNIYGDLTGGTNQMEESLKQANPDFFWKTYYNKGWVVSTLPESEVTLLNDYYKEVMGWQLDDSEPLLSVSINGFSTDERYLCDVDIDASILSCLKKVLK